MGSVRLMWVIMMTFGVSMFAWPQSPQAAVKPSHLPTFQVATIKPSRPGESMTIQIRGHRFATTDCSFFDILKYAYGLHASQIVDGPEWLKTERFDILADPETESRPTSDEMKRMVRDLLADRFQFVFHRDKRDLPVYAIVVAKNGAKLTKSTRDPNGIPAVSYTPGWLNAGDATMPDFASFLQRYVTDRPVVDQTGIPGKYDLSLHWTPDESEHGGVFPGLYTAIQEQLGLKLEAVKAPVEVFVVDHVERPSAD